MSRRSRRRKGKAANPWMARGLIGGLVLVMLVLGGGFLGIRWYLHSDGFRRLLSQQTGKALDAEAEFGAFRWHGMQVKTDSFTASGETGPVVDLRADGVGLEIGLGGIRRGVWELQGGLVRNLDVSLDLTRERPEAEKPRREKPKERSGGWLPDQVELHDAEISNLDMRAKTEDGIAVLSGMRVQAQSDGTPKSYLANLQGGVLQFPVEGAPVIEFHEANLRIGEEAVFLTRLEATAWGRARLEAVGEWDQSTGRGVIEGQVRDVPTSEMLKGDWIKRVSGKVQMDFTARVDETSKSAQGEIRLENGMLTALPILDVLAAYADTGRFRILTLHDARCQWSWRDGVWRFSDLILSSDGLARLEGDLQIRGEELDGNFRLGIPQGTLAHIPGAETVVFLPGEHGLLWAPIRITGTLDDPEEDLSGRLILAAGLRMFDELPETGEKVLKFSNRLAGDVAPKAIEEGLRILEKNQDTIQEAAGILEGILGKPIPTPKLPLIPE